MIFKSHLFTSTPMYNWTLKHVCFLAFFYLRPSPLLVLVHCSKENRLKISQISKLAKNTPNNDKRTKQTRIPSFWGDVGVKKWSLFSDLAAQSPIFWAFENKHLFKKCPILGTKKWDYGRPNPKTETTFFMPISPQIGGIDICFMCLSLLCEF